MTVAAATPATPAQTGTWHVRPLAAAPPRFRPGAWSEEDVLWGLVAGRLTRLDVRSGETRTMSETAWWMRGASNAVAWQNEAGTWLRRGNGAPVRLAGPDGDPERAGDGPSVLLAPDGHRAILGWHHEWDALHDLLETDGSRTRLETKIRGYFLNSAVLWLDSTRVLFQTVANGPVGGEPTYRESGWRGDLAVFDLRTNAYSRVTSVPDSIYLRVAGRYLNGVLVTEWSTTGVRGHWLYDTATWERRPLPVPGGRAFASAAGAVVVLIDPQGDSTEAVLVGGRDTIPIGRVARDGEPAFSPSGRRGALRTARGVMLLERLP
jgi:hypothetical protein